jgi:hypothetical protein
MQRPPTRRRHSSPIQPPRPRPTPRRSSAGLPILDFPANQEDATPARQRHSSPYYTSPVPGQIKIKEEEGIRKPYEQNKMELI